MPKQHDSAKDHKLSEWLTSEIGEDTSNEEHAVWQQRIRMAEKLTHHADSIPEHDVLSWDRNATFEHNSTSWWQWRGLPAVSFAFSLFAIGLVLLRVEIVVQDQGVLLSFSGDTQALKKQQFETLIDQKLQTFASEQQVILANHAADIKVNQQENNLQLASYIMGASRQERKEDIGDFLQYINDQRADDKYNQNMKIQQLADTMLYQKSMTETPSVKLTPAQWTIEE